VEDRLVDGALVSKLVCEVDSPHGGRVSDLKEAVGVSDYQILQIIWRAIQTRHFAIRRLQ